MGSRLFKFMYLFFQRIQKFSIKKLKFSVSVISSLVIKILIFWYVTAQGLVVLIYYHVEVKYAS